jgi:very-short-patch-repair endonuclease
MGTKGDTRVRRAAEIARRQHGVVSIAQLRAVGFGKSSVRRGTERGWLHRVHRGVYAMGHAGISVEGRWMAAVLASGEGAVLSHASAAAHWGLLRPVDGPVDISVPTGAGRRRRTGIRLHRCASLAGTGTGLVTKRAGIPVTTPARTIADLPATVPPRLVRRARRQAELVGMPLGDLPSDRTRSDLERAFLRLCRGHGLPTPEVNAVVGPWTVDFLWPRRRLIVETDGYLYHRGRVASEDDHERDLSLRELGYDVVRLSERHVTQDAHRTAARVAKELGIGHPQ